MPTNKKKKSKLKNELRRQRRERTEESLMKEKAQAFLQLPKPKFLLPAPPSYTITISGIPSAGGNEGFRGLGKLTGCHRSLWRAGMKALVCDFANEKPKVKLSIDVSDCGPYENVAAKTLAYQLPLFALLSPNQQIRLLREVAVGLLCKETPFPPETIWHYAAYFAPLTYVTYVAVKEELEDEKTWKDLAQEEKGEAAMMSADEEVDSARKEQERKAIQKNIKRERDKKSTATLVKDMEAETAAVRQRFENWSKLEESKSLKERMGEFCKLEGRLFAHMHGGEEPLWSYYWRRLVIEYLNEAQDEKTNIKNQTLLQIFREDFEYWEKVYIMGAYSSLIPWPQGKNALFFGLLFGPVDYEHKTSRGRLIERSIRRSSKLFGSNWSSESSANDFRYLAVLFAADEEEEIPYRFCEGIFEESTRILGDSDKARKKSSQSFSTVAWFTDEDKDAENFPVGAHQAIHRWSWAHLWHNEMQLDPTLYSSPDARVKAVQTIDTKIQLYEPEGSVCKKAWTFSPCAGCEFDVANFSPEDLNAEEERCDECSKIEGKECAELLACRRCGVAQYCGQDCQKRAWPNHKKVCKDLKLIVEKGKGATTISSDVAKKHESEQS